MMTYMLSPGTSHSGSNTPSKYDPIGILEESKVGNKFRRAEYGIASATALNSVGTIFSAFLSDII